MDHIPGCQVPPTFLQIQQVIFHDSIPKEVFASLPREAKHIKHKSSDVSESDEDKKALEAIVKEYLQLTFSHDQRSTFQIIIS